MLGRYYFSLLCSSLIAGSAGMAHAQQVSDVPSARERTLLAESYTSERLWVWQKRLNLQEWNISVVVVPAGELKPKTLGNVHWELEKKRAVIRVLDPADYTLPFNEMLKDMEFTVVHELIHLELAPVLSDLHRSDANRREEEHAVNHVADALLNLGRKP
ncbi:MAG TPA: hypothetical protein VNY05_16745 [Candidatus Acidoferrales bacterium]|jgi:hypothetical protein|nr:hypothetical protein [Candidatus Acidoferrales bacterium]